MPSIGKLVKKNNISYLALFGSFAREDAGPDSDVDMIVDFATRVSYFDLIRIEREFSTLLGRKVDLVTERSIKKNLRPFINEDKKVLFYDENKPRLYQRYPKSYRID